MKTAFGTIPPFSQQVAERETLNLTTKPRCAGRPAPIACSNVAVRTDDFDAFVDVIRTREALLAEPDTRFGTGDLVRARAIASHALAAGEAIEAGNADPLAIAALETTAALAIGLLVDLKGKA